MNQKIKESKEFIRDMLDKHKFPAVLCSFGKDSMAMLHLIRTIKKDLPVIYWRHPFFQRKHKFADDNIKEMDLTVYDWPPIRVGFDCVEGVGHSIQYHQFKPGGKSVAFMMGVVPMEEGKEFLCAIKDLFGRPTSIFNAPWDVCFHGHKACDEDPVTGKIPISENVLKIESMPTFAYPMKDWTDDDVFSYLEENKVPINTDRYEKIEGKWGSKSDKRMNNDYYHACWNCVDKNKGKKVFCPIEKREISNISEKVVYDKLQLKYLGR